MLLLHDPHLNNVKPSCLCSATTIHMRYLNVCFILRPNKKISLFQVMGLKILGRVGRLFFFFNFFFLEKKYDFMHFERQMPFKMHKIISPPPPRKPEKNQSSSVNLGWVWFP